MLSTSNMKNQTTLAIDFGTKRIGLAITYSSLVEPLVILDNDKEVFNNLLEIIKEEKIEQILIGISEAEMAKKTKVFAKQLEKKLDKELTGKIPFYFFDESFSSKNVEQRLRQKGIKASKRKGHIDHYAAALFLEEWLESNPQSARD